MLRNTLPPLDDVLDFMASHLRNHERLPAVAAHWNGFEGWLKFELAVALRARHQLVPWEASGNKWQRGGIGVEYQYRSATRNDESRRKLIDLWIGHNPTYYFELKTVFRNANRDKQLASWQSDFAVLESILEDDPTAAGYASIVFAVGYADMDWTSALAARPHVDETIERDFGVLAENDETGRIRAFALCRARRQ
jgi:hypothetical protein